MTFFKALSVSFFIVVTLYLSLSFTSIHAAVFEIYNNCNYTIWAAAAPGGGRMLNQDQTWVVNTDPNFQDIGRIWARTNCNFDAKGIAKCESGDCGGVLYCGSDAGTPPVTLAEYSFNKFNGLDFFDISLIDGFNVPMEFKGNSSECSGEIRCTGDINGLCPTELRDPGGCNHPCTVFNNNQFCCRSVNTCSATVYSNFFKELCPNVYTYALDETNTTFTCPSGSDYKIVFCP